MIEVIPRSQNGKTEPGGQNEATTRIDLANRFKTINLSTIFQEQKE